MTYQSSYRVCPKCGYRSNEDSKFCLHCGENIESVEVTKVWITVCTEKIHLNI